jgi:hypothetical protein
MSQETIGLVVDRLLSDECLRTQFALDPLETIADLHVRGLELTSHEIDVLMQTDARTWFSIDRNVEGRAH